MAKIINCNVAGEPTSPAVISDDVPRIWIGVFEPGNTRCVFTLPDDAAGGGHLRWSDQNVNFLLPATPGSYEGASLGLPTLVYKSVSVMGLHIADNCFVTTDGLPFLICGHTEMLGPARMRAGEDIRPILKQRAEAGCNMIRPLGMGYPFWSDQSPVSMAILHDFVSMAADYDLYVLWCVFAGTGVVPGASDPAWQLDLWARSCDALRQHPNALVMGANEYNHGSQRIDPRILPKPQGILSMRGSATTDGDPAKPVMDLEGYSARRESDSALGFTNCDPYEFQRTYPCVPKIALENAKPESYGFAVRYARLMGLHMKASEWGGFGHTQAGVISVGWNGGEEACLRVLYDAVQHG